MAAKKILRIRRTDVDSHDEATPAYALVSVEPAGPQPLDVRLVGTEGENVFAASIRESQIKNFRDRKNKTGDDHEWETILRDSLLNIPAGGDDARLLDNLEIVASVSDQRLNITVRKNIQGITQRLGAIPLAEDRDTEIEFFEWTAIAVEAASAARDEARNLQNKYEAQQVTISELKSQLDDLIQAKHDHENALLAKFQELLNAKKLKIRDQQRLLAGAKVDPAAAAAVEHARGSTRHTRPRKAGPSRASKRKANGKTPATEVESEPDEGSRMEVDENEAGAKQDEEEELPVTPEKSDLDETEDEDEDDEDLDATPEELPPRRELPFTRKQSNQPSRESGKKAPVTAAPDDEDETTDDDEL
ncbi:putative dna double-strand break repair and vj recombination xrcc4 protein [Neofusicoccum parvum UCRNP2]|uniref:Putative dna double-strand break repair and vj recombination xrcc4 protein n=1 Tax=Botryosphaeria parva (strain UCR-NP2) TaxID=1287680 RepID=R1GTX2_BOTPV|nr:putative dna double-strand break repair and vj recombination xrcc4 protein [Neofusicoccum parvum UCRNP2]